MAGIYLHVPFCHAKCAYCDFYSVADSRYTDRYVSAVVDEFSSRRLELGNQPVKTLYFGGGTPSLLTPGQFTLLAKALAGPDVEEFTIEVNPEDVVPAKVEAWLAAGVNRVSMGVQSLVDEELKAVNRRHSAAEALKALELLGNIGISNISCDLIYGLPGQTLQSWEHSLTTLLEQGIQHLSAYNLSFEEGTLLNLKLRKGLVEEATDELVQQMYDTLCARAAGFGFEHYEISNFAKPGFASRHNSSYWDHTPYLGLGPGAHSLDVQGLRRYVPPGLKAYLANPAEAAVIDTEDDRDRINDLIFTALRTSRGLAAEDLPKECEAVVRRFVNQGLMVEKEGRVAIPEKYFLISDSIIREIFI